MSRLLAHAPVPARALDALDVTRARRNGKRKARRNGCGCGPGCGCAPCMEKWGAPGTVALTNPRRNGNILVADPYPGKPQWGKRRTLDISPVARTMFTGNDPSGGRGTTTHTSWVEPAEQPAARDAYKRVEAFVGGLPKSELVRLLREVGARHAYVEEKADSLRARLHNLLYERMVPYVRANGTVGGLVAGAAAMHVAHRAGWMKNGRKARKNHHLRAGDRVRFRGSAGQSLGTGVVTREVDPVRDLYAVRWENGSKHVSVDGALLVKVARNPVGYKLARDLPGPTEPEHRRYRLLIDEKVVSVHSTESAAREAQRKWERGEAARMERAWRAAGKPVGLGPMYADVYDREGLKAWFWSRAHARTKIEHYTLLRHGWQWT